MRYLGLLLFFVIIVVFVAIILDMTVIYIQIH